jgi:type II secretory pathway component GspD/PulD (secretin)
MRPTFVCAGLALVLAVSASAAPDPKKPGPIDDSAQIAEKLLDRMEIGQRMDKVPFREVLEYLQAKTGLTILADNRAIRAEGDMGAIDDMQITLPAMKNVRVETVIHQVLDQMDLDYVIASDHVRITTHRMKDLITGQARRLPELYPVPPGEDQPEMERKDTVRTAGNVTVAFRDTPVSDAFKEIAARAGRTVVVSAPAADKAKSAVTLTLSNVPFETAAAGLAEAAGLRAFRTGSIVVIVTAERAKSVESAADNLPGVLLGGGPGRPAMSLEELESISRIFAGKGGDADVVRRELQKLRDERVTIDAERQKLEEQVKKLTAELEKARKK